MTLTASFAVILVVAGCYALEQREVSESRMQSVEGQLAQILGEISTVYSRIDGLGSRISAIENKEVIAFSAKATPGYIHPSTESNIRFDDVKVNVGGGYNTGQAAFVCPKAGLYSVSVSMQSARWTDSRKGSAGYIFHDRVSGTDERVAEFLAYRGDSDNSAEAQVATSAVVNCQQGDKISIRPILTYWSVQFTGARCVFSGFLIQ